MHRCRGRRDERESRSIRAGNGDEQATYRRSPQRAQNQAFLGTLPNRRGGESKEVGTIGHRIPRRSFHTETDGARGGEAEDGTGLGRRILQIAGHRAEVVGRVGNQTGEHGLDPDLRRTRRQRALPRRCKGGGFY